MSWVDDPFAYVGSAGAPVATPTVNYTPLAAWTIAQRISIYRGSGVPITFAQLGTVVAIDPSAYEARLGPQESASPIRFTVANGKLSEGDGGKLVVNVTAADTDGLSLTEPVVLELWRLDADDSQTVVGKAKVTVMQSIYP